MRKYIVSHSVYLRWKHQFEQGGSAALKPQYRKIDPKLRAFHEENDRLKKIIGNQSLELEFKTELSKKGGLRAEAQGLAKMYAFRRWLQGVRSRVFSDICSMNVNYPFVPKSNAKLQPGHFWPIKLANEKYACGIVLDVPREKGRYTTRMFYVGLLDWVGVSKPTANNLEAVPLKILDQGKAHIATITMLNEAIEGWIDLMKNNLQIELRVDCAHYDPFSKVVRGYEVVRKATIEDHKDLENLSAWGAAVIYDSANSLLGDSV